MKTTKALQGLFNLDHNIRVYVPSTIEVNKSINNAYYVNDTLEHFSNWFGGATSFEAMGAWTSKEHGLVTEKVIIVESYATGEAVEKYIAEVIKLCENLKKQMSQEAISLEYDNKLYFI